MVASWRCQKRGHWGSCSRHTRDSASLVGRQIVLFLFAKSYIAEIADVFNIDQHMARAMALVLWVIIIFFVSKLFSISHANRRIGFYGLLFFFLSAKRYCFRTGRKTTSLSRHPANQQSVTCSPERGKIGMPFEHAGVDPVTGRVCQRYLRKLLSAYEHTPEESDRSEFCLQKSTFSTFGPASQSFGFTETKMGQSNYSI